jgi:hypothetical protein
LSLNFAVAGIWKTYWGSRGKPHRLCPKAFTKFLISHNFMCSGDCSLFSEFPEETSLKSGVSESSLVGQSFAVWCGQVTALSLEHKNSSTWYIPSSVPVKSNHLQLHHVCQQDLLLLTAFSKRDVLCRVLS